MSSLRVAKEPPSSSPIIVFGWWGESWKLGGLFVERVAVAAAVAAAGEVDCSTTHARGAIHHPWNTIPNLHNSPPLVSLPPLNPILPTNAPYFTPHTSTPPSNAPGGQAQAGHCTHQVGRGAATAAGRHADQGKQTPPPIHPATIHAITNITNTAKTLTCLASPPHTPPNFRSCARSRNAWQAT